MTTTAFHSVSDYLHALRMALRDADPALQQDALYDAEEYLRAACAEQAPRPEAEVLAEVIRHFGTPEEVAAGYRETELTVAKALRAPAPKAPQSLFGKVFGVYVDPRTYASLFYMFLALFSGIFYFTWAVTGAGLSAGFAILIFGVPFFLLFIGSVRLISLVEGRVIEVLLGERMPRRPVYTPQGNTTTQRIGERILAMLKDPRTWSTLLYMVAMLPVGIAYFTAAVIGLALSFAMMLAPFHGHYFHLGHDTVIHVPWVLEGFSEWPMSLWLVPIGFQALTLLLHVARLVGRLHGKVAKHLLVRAVG